MVHLEQQSSVKIPELARWGISAALVLAAHISAIVAVCWRSNFADLEPGSPVALLSELAPVSVASPAPLADLAPGPQQPAAESEERARQEATPKQTEPDPIEQHEDTPAENPAVVLPPPVPKPAEEPARVEQQPTAAAPVPTAPPPAEAPAPRPAAPTVGSKSQTAAQIASWQRLLVSHLQQFKRYPPQANGQIGVASVTFSIDRRGRPLTSRILHSSGSAILDGETLALIKRAEPFPAPPASVPENQLSFVVPIRYATSGSR